MTTTLYLHSATDSSTGLPTAEQSTLTANDNFEADQTTNRVMNRTKGSAQTSLANSSTAATGNKKYYVARWISPKIAQTSIAANTWTYNFAAKESNASANFPVSGTTGAAVYVNAYVWRTSTQAVVGTIRDNTTNNNYKEYTNERSQHGTFTGAQVLSTTPGDDVIILEAWFSITQAASTSYTQTFYFDGGTQTDATGTTVSDHAAYLSTPENIGFLSALSNSSTITITDSSTKQFAGTRAVNENITHDGDVNKGTKRIFLRTFGGVEYI